ncbi:RodZ family helix-turn-helix domain-containing protein [Hyphomicrobium sp. 99]|uniref:helix-turn-helix domain-containing protein n=1 Tax=Hyphomicrobium sp. 99 TaxID=1163419 RepID=UPI0005F7EA31|nr:helix-turn-helix domain-containing protein [Hyphomicrobium sp. 99]
MRRGFVETVPVGGYEYARPVAARVDSPQHQQIAESGALIGQFFIDLRRALHLTLPQAAEYLQVRPEVIEALETGQVEYLPDWHDTSAIVMTYTSMAGVNGRPALNAIGSLISYFSSLTPAPRQPTITERLQQQQPLVSYQPQPSAYAQPFQPRPEPGVQVGSHVASQAVAQASLPARSQPARPARIQAAGNFMRAGSAFANGARRLPQEALNQVRQRPQRALYALSLPLGFLLLLMHSSIFDTVARPFGSAVRWVSSYFQEHYGPVRDGLRYIEVDDPRSRRGDKLQISGGSY